MRFAFHTVLPIKEMRQKVGNALALGAAKFGDTVSIVVEDEYIEPRQDFDGCVIHGIAGQVARKIFDDYLAAGKHVLFFDKGYSREDVVRVAVNAFQPTKYLMKIKRPGDRLTKFGVELKIPKKYSANDNVILFDGASGKYCQWCKLGDQLEWGQSVVNKIRQHTKREIIYRPRPSHNKAQYVEGAHTSQLILDVEFKRAHIVVSHGGNLGWDAIIAGLPHFMLSESIAAPMSEINWPQLETPLRPNLAARQQWAQNVAYCQWTYDELADGSAWYVIREQLASIKGNLTL
jgi:hypothetical protein